MHGGIISTLLMMMTASFFCVFKSQNCVQLPRAIFAKQKSVLEMQRRQIVVAWFHEQRDRQSTSMTHKKLKIPINQWHKIRRVAHQDLEFAIVPPPSLSKSLIHLLLWLDQQLVTSVKVHAPHDLVSSKPFVKAPGSLTLTKAY